MKQSEVFERKNKDLEGECEDRQQERQGPWQSVIKVQTEKVANLNKCVLQQEASGVSSGEV